MNNKELEKYLLDSGLIIDDPGNAGKYMFNVPVSSDGGGSNITPANSTTGEQSWSLASNSLNITAMQAWKTANPTKSILNITNLNGNDGVTTLLIQHTL